MSPKKMKPVVAAMLAGSLSLAALAIAAEPVGSPDAKQGWHHHQMKKFDANKDGKLDDTEREKMHEQMRAKFEERHQEALKEFDANKDGKLDEAERKKMHEVRSASRFKELDTNKDGNLSLTEFQAGGPPRPPPPEHE